MLCVWDHSGNFVVLTHVPLTVGAQASFDANKVAFAKNCDVHSVWYVFAAMVRQMPGFTVQTVFGNSTVSSPYSTISCVVQDALSSTCFPP